MNKEEILKQVGFDLDKAKQIHKWLTGPVAAIEPSEVVGRIPPIVSKYYGEDGRPDGVRLCVGDEELLVTLHDEFDGKDVDWYQIEKNDIQTFNRKQAALVSAYLPEVNKMIKEMGGDPFTDWYWTNETCEANGDCAWCLIGSYGNLGYNGNRYSACRVRRVLAFGFKIDV